MPKSKCLHDGDFFPKDSRPSIQRDPILGWVVAVRCGKCMAIGTAAVDYKNINWDERQNPPKLPKMTNEELEKTYGPFSHIDTDREKELLNTGKWRHILTIIGYDVPYDELPEDERPSDEELQTRGETRESHMGYMQDAVVGHHAVNVDEIFESARPMPRDFTIKNFWFDDFLKAP